MCSFMAKHVIYTQYIPSLSLLRIFKLNPNAQALFPKFASVPADELESNIAFRAHALTVMEAVELASSMLDELSDLRDILIGIGSVHAAKGLHLQSAHFDVSASCVRVRAHADN